MPRKEQPLPQGWEEARDFDGKVYYIDHIHQATSWIDPRDRQTKPLSFADCIGDELPIGWEEAYDPVVGAYYVDHNTKSTQLEDPRAQWQQEQEVMLREYLEVAHHAISAQEEIYQVKEQRLLLAQQEYQLLHDTWRNKSTSQTSLNSRSSSSSRYDPEILKAEIITAKSRVNRLKRDLSSMKQELQFKQQGFETLKGIDLKVSSCPQGYQPQEAQAIMKEVHSLRDAISSGEKEKQALIQKLAVLKDGFPLDSGSEQELWGSSLSLGPSELSLPRLYSEAGSQTDIPAEVGSSANNQLAEKVRLSLKYEEAKRRISGIEVQIARLDSEAWPGLLDPERDRLILINEKEELLKELSYARPPRHLQPSDAQRIESQKKRLETDLQAARHTQSKALTERLRLHCKRNKLVRDLESSVRLAASLHTQLKSLSASTLSCSSGSSRGSLATTSSLGSTSSLSFSDLYLERAPDMDPDLQNKLELLLGGGFRPSMAITTIHEHEVVSGAGPGAGPHPEGSPEAGSPRLQALRLTETPPPPSVGSLSPRSSLSSLSPPCSPLAAASFLTPGEEEGEGEGEGAQEHGGGAGGEEEEDLRETTPQGVELRESAPPLRASGAGSNNVGVSSAVSDESVAGDSGVYEPSERRPGQQPSSLLPDDEASSLGCAQVQLGLRYQDQRFSVAVLQLANCSALCLPEDHHMHVRVVVLPCSENARCLFRTRAFAPKPSLEVNEVFGLSMSHNALRQKTLRVDVCHTSSSGRESCLAGAQVSLAEEKCSEKKSSRWFNLLSHADVTELAPQVEKAPAPEPAPEPAAEEASEEADRLDGQQAAMSNSIGAGPHEEGEELHQESSQWAAEEEVHDEDQQRPGTTTTTTPIKERVNKETSTGGTSVRPKQRPPDPGPGGGHMVQQSFIRGNTVIRSKTFSPGPQSHYICRINRSDSDSSTLSKKSPFVRNASERRSMRVKKPVVAGKTLDGLLRTSMDLEMDLQVSRTRQARLDQELLVLRELKEQMEKARQEGRRELPLWVQQDQRFRQLLRRAERQTQEEQQQEHRVEQMMKAAAKDVHKMTSRQEVPEVQNFRDKMAFLTRARSSIPDLPSHDV
ncbi:protein KIBRA [Gadus chalcogrammus]|uniref:protein KIBRA n=1 Tax=Gadus chalcogrammus TaxID=1042646 RepID=UPI0024C2C421|nr:protein KIBRA [Gadus chalcogrammus]